MTMDPEIKGIANIGNRAAANMGLTDHAGRGAMENLLMTLKEGKEFLHGHRSILINSEMVLKVIEFNRELTSKILTTAKCRWKIHHYCLYLDIVLNAICGLDLEIKHAAEYTQIDHSEGRLEKLVISPKYNSLIFTHLRNIYWSLQSNEEMRTYGNYPYNGTIMQQSSCLGSAVGRMLSHTISYQDPLQLYGIIKEIDPITCKLIFANDTLSLEEHEHHTKNFIKAVSYTHLTLPTKRIV